MIIFDQMAKYRLLFHGSSLVMGWIIGISVLQSKPLCHFYNRAALGFVLQW